MYKPTVAVVSLVAGIAVTAHAWQMQHKALPPQASSVPSTVEQENERVSSAASEQVRSAKAPMASEAPLPQKAREPAFVSHKKSARKLSPCSDWRALGPKAIENTDGSVDQRRVRQLC